MATMYVTYPGDAATHFDREHYVRTHLPLVMKAWGPYRLETAAAFFPAGDGAGTIAVCLCGFRDEAAIGAALASPGTGAVMADVKNFNDEHIEAFDDLADPSVPLRRFISQR